MAFLFFVNDHFRFTAWRVLFVNLSNHSTSYSGVLFFILVVFNKKKHNQTLLFVLKTLGYKIFTKKESLSKIDKNKFIEIYTKKNYSSMSQLLLKRCITPVFFSIFLMTLFSLKIRRLHYISDSIIGSNTTSYLKGTNFSRVCIFARNRKFFILCVLISIQARLLVFILFHIFTEGT